MNQLHEILNDQQLKGVTTTDGPVLILAGAGSGKTRVLTHRVAYLIEECGIDPYHIMAITFTNKAAKEMKERIESLIGLEAGYTWVMTFHATCVRFLRRFADRIGYENNFTIYDTDDTKTVMREVMRKLNIDSKKIRETYFLNRISGFKNELLGPEDIARTAGFDRDLAQLASVYRNYQVRLKDQNAFDFDDLIMKSVELLRSEPEVQKLYQERFQYIMVDEYQDTNTAQFALIELLAREHRNLCVVGDDDQSIYRFRGANIKNILDFEDNFPGAVVIKLEQNYRSMQSILDVANSVIKNNSHRKEKRLWTQNGEGQKIIYRQFDSAFEEAENIARDIKRCKRNGTFPYSSMAVLYRTNAQSRILEEKLLNADIPYRIVGGINFYSRKEIKDILAYLKTITNEKDDLSARRIINVPRRGIGQTTISRIADYADNNDMSFYQALQRRHEIPSIGRAMKKLDDFATFMESLKVMADDYSVADLIKKILELTGYSALIASEDTQESRSRLENIDELISKASIFDSEKDGGLSAFLEEVALVADIDRLEEDTEYVVLMTLHSAKGLEFDSVYITGLEDGLFPSYMSITADYPDEEIAEERRLMYVGITRAKKRLFLSAARSRMVRGRTEYNAASRFVSEIPDKLVDGSVPLGRRSHNEFATIDTEGIAYTAAGRIPQTTPRERMRRQIKSAPKDFGTKIEKKPLDYKVGDQVKHAKFGVGRVLGINDGGRDYEVSVEFSDGKTRKLFASFAKLIKV